MSSRLLHCLWIAPVVFIYYNKYIKNKLTINSLQMILLSLIRACTFAFACSISIIHWKPSLDGIRFRISTLNSRRCPLGTTISCSILNDGQCCTPLINEFCALYSKWKNQYKVHIIIIDKKKKKKKKNV